MALAPLLASNSTNNKKSCEGVHTITTTSSCFHGDASQQGKSLQIDSSSLESVVISIDSPMPQHSKRLSELPPSFYSLKEKTSHEDSKTHDVESESVEYSAIYQETYRIMDLLKLVVTVVYITIGYDVLELVKLSGPGKYPYGLLLMEAFAYIVYLIPWVYLFIYRNSPSPTRAVGDARRRCLGLILALTYGCMILIGCFLACDFVSDLPSTERIPPEHAFLFFLARSTALPTTVSLAFAVLSSPGVRSWFTLPLHLQYLLLPLIWLPPYTVQEIHVASGANFTFMGVIHSFAWISLLGLGLVEVNSCGMIVAIITGSFMLIISVKLLWPPGVPIPFAKIIEVYSPAFRRLGAFLKDGKYGSAHVYLASFVFSLYLAHATVIMKQAKSWYFAFAVFSMCVLFMAHPAKRLFRGFIIKMFCQACSSDYVIVSKVVRQLRGNAANISAVYLDIELPPQMDAKKLAEGHSDIIIVRNKATGFFRRFWESAHYFSVVAIEEIGIVPRNTVAGDCNEDTKLKGVRVTLLIQKTRRPDGASTALVRQKPKQTDGGGGDIEKQRDLESKFDTENIHQKVSIIGFIKSNSFGACFSPCIIAFGFESGAAAFCSMLKHRMFLRNQVEETSTGIKKSLLTDLCVVWTTFPRRKTDTVTASDVTIALRELEALQQFLYDSSTRKCK